MAAGVGDGERGRLLENGTVVHLLGYALNRGGASLKNVPELLKRCIREGCWQRRLIEQTGAVQEFARFEDFVATPPLEGLGATVQLLQDMCAHDQEARDLIDGAVQRPVGTNQHTMPVDNINSQPRPDGNSKDYALRRLRKHRPDLHRRVIGGELSAHRAMVIAGFREEPTPLEAAKRAAARLSAEDRRALAEWLRQGAG